MKYILVLFLISWSSCQLPPSFDWSAISNSQKTVNYLTVTRNGNIPQYCNSSWAFAVASAMGDRIKILRNAAWPDIDIAPQVLLSCDTSNQGCTGGNPMDAYKYITSNNITDETCSVYKGWGLDNGLTCSDSLICGCYCSQTESGSYTCEAVPDHLVFNLKNYSQLANNETSLMQEIYTHGPIVCGISATNAFMSYSSGILNDTTGSTTINHYVSIVGWGIQNGVKYWHVRNSWGSAWGEQGYFRIIKGVNNLGIEQQCSQMYPQDTWTAYQQSIQQTQSEDYIFNQPQGEQYKRKHRNKGAKPWLPKTSHVISPQPFEYLSPNDVPDNWDWRNVNNTNFLSWNKNQLCCGSCWSEGTTSAFADRINILQNAQFPYATVATQAVLNCAPTFGDGCAGGQVTEAYRWIHDDGIGDETCQQYIAESGFKLWCSDKKKCDMCSGPAPTMSQGFGAGNCDAVTSYKKYQVKEYGTVSGVDNMKAEIYARGPIGCSISTPPAFDSYQGFSIMNIPDEGYQVDHIISVVGFGVENGTSYWIGRNSWGTYWGYYGYFRINMNDNNLFINDDCSWAVPQE